jgi:hypothetical protein
MSMEVTRRRALQSLALWLAASPLLEGQDAPPKLIGEPPGRITPVDELVNVLEAEAMAKRLLNSPLYAKIAGSDRSYFARITLQPSMMIDVRKLDMSLDLFGTKMFAPILVGPALVSVGFESPSLCWEFQLRRTGGAPYDPRLHAGLVYAAFFADAFVAA